MALNLGILGRIGIHLGFSTSSEDSDTQQKSDFDHDKQSGGKDGDTCDEHEGRQYGYSGDNNRGEGGWQDKDNSDRNQYADNGGREWQNDGKYASNDEHQDKHDLRWGDGYSYGDQHGDNSGSPLYEPDYASNDYGANGSWGNDEGDLHAVLAALPDTGAMLDAAISHLDSSVPCDIGCADVTPFDDHGGSTGIA
jgi:hypothetical protein